MCKEHIHNCEFCKLLLPLPLHLCALGRTINVKHLINIIIVLFVLHIKIYELLVCNFFVSFSSWISYENKKKKHQKTSYLLCLSVSQNRIAATSFRNGKLNDHDHTYHIHNFKARRKKK